MPGENSQRGFTLLELIAALAIVALVSAALFQSTGQWLRLSTQASDAANESLSGVANQTMFSEVVSGIVQAWPEEIDRRFIGEPAGFSGLTKTPLHGIAPNLSHASMSIVSNGSAAGVIYRSGDIEWILKTLDNASAGFSYLGADGVWRSAWPPSETPEPGPFNDAQFYDTPNAPLAIRLTIDGPGGSETWIADIAGNPQLPMRVQDLLAREQ